MSDDVGTWDGGAPHIAHQEDPTMLAYDFPLIGVFWSLLMFSLFVLWIVIVIYCFVDNFRRRDHHGIAKALWFLFIVFVPV
ncbi:MAG TPA: PLDc N-terminal domain-containing protein, partial [Acidimicrobiales bacterium]